MATAEVKTVVTKTVSLTMNQTEAEALLSVLAYSNSDNVAAAFLDTVRDALREAGVEIYRPAFEVKPA